MNYIKLLLSRIFRYKLVSVCFIIGQLIAYFTIFGALQIYNSAMAKEEDRINSIYDNRITVIANAMAQKDILKKAGEGIDQGNVLLSGRMSVTSEDMNSACRAEMLLAVNEELPYKMLSGHIPGTEASDAGKNVVALGRDKYKFTYERDGKRYIHFCMEEYEVVGILGSASDYWDYKIVFHVNSIGEKTLKKMLCMNEYEIHLDSNEASHDELIEEYNKLYANIMYADNAAEIKANTDTDMGKVTISTTYARENIKVNYIVYIFCLINNVIVSYFWIISRSKEIAVRQTFGYTRIQLVCMLIKDMAVMMVSALAIFIVIYGLCKGWLNQYFNIYIKLNTLGELAVILLITTIISVMYPIYKVMRMHNAQAVRIE